MIVAIIRGKNWLHGHGGQISGWHYPHQVVLRRPVIKSHYVNGKRRARLPHNVALETSEPALPHADIPNKTWVHIFIRVSKGGKEPQALQSAWSDKPALKDEVFKQNAMLNYYFPYHLALVDLETWPVDFSSAYFLRNMLPVRLKEYIWRASSWNYSTFWTILLL